MRACKRGSRNVKISLKGVALDPGDDAEEEFKEDFSGCEGDAHEEDPNGYVPSRDDWPSAATVDEIEERQSATPQQEQGGDQDNIADRVMHWGDYDTVEPASTTPRYDAEVAYAVKRLSDAIGPVLIVGLASVVGFFAMAIFLPMWDMSRVAFQH